MFVFHFYFHPLISNGYECTRLKMNKLHEIVRSWISLNLSVNRFACNKKVYFCAMLMKMRFFVPVLMVLTVILSSCGSYNKIVKSTDYEYKYKKADRKSVV